MVALGQVRSDRGFNYKIPDDSRSFKPFDGFFMRGELAYVGIAFGEKLTGFYLVPVREVVRLIDSGVKSISEDECKSVGDYYSLPTLKK